MTASQDDASEAQGEPEGTPDTGAEGSAEGSAEGAAQEPAAKEPASEPASAPEPAPAAPPAATPAPSPSEGATPSAAAPAAEITSPTPAPPPRGRREPTATGRYTREGIVAALRQPFLRSLLRVPLKKVAIWACFLGLLYALREFFGLIFLTFVISYISAAIVARISPHFTNRKIPVVLVFGTIVGTVLALGVATVPRAVRQGQHQLEKLRQIKDPKVFFERWLAEKLGTKPPKHPEGSAASGASAIGQALENNTPPAQAEADEEDEPGWFARFAGYLNDPEINRVAADTLAKAGQDYLIPYLKSTVTGIYGGAAYFVVALIFSFMIVWDLPRLARGVEHMERSRLGDVWIEVAPSIASFFRLLGKAFEAQTMIALVNTAITALGMWFLGLPGIGFLALIVFICSFIPIVGMIISTVPICVVALQVENGGAGLVVAVLVMVAVAHALEAYVLNPRIYGFHMKLHPLAVLIVLYLGQHLFGVWGLVMGVPMATYVWRYLILGEEDPDDSFAGEAAPAASPAPTGA